MPAVKAPTTPTIITPAAPGWDEARQAWNLAVDQHPAAVAFPRSAADVAATVNYAPCTGPARRRAGHRSQRRATCGSPRRLDPAPHRQHAAGHDRPQAARTARVEAGALWLDVTAAAAEHGLAGLAGSSPDVGVIGYTLGGGLAWLRVAPTASPPIMSTAIEFVTADGLRDPRRCLS